MITQFMTRMHNKENVLYFTNDDSEALGKIDISGIPDNMRAEIAREICERWNVVQRANELVKGKT